MKLSLSIHETSLAAREAHHARTLERINREKLEVLEHMKRDRFYATQIAEAKRRGLDGFDEDRLLIKRAKTK